MKINTETIKEIGKAFMVIGASLFSCGVGTYWVGCHIEKKETKLTHDAEMYKINKEHVKEENELKKSALEAAVEKDRIYAERLKNMDSTEFAKFHAERITKANQDVLAQANEIKNKAESDIAMANMECTNTVTEIRKDCLEKIKEANAERDEALKKYNAINTLFTNKDAILKAEEYLKKAVEKNERAKNDKEDLLEGIKSLLED